MFEDSDGDSPYRTTKHPGAVQVFGAYPHFRKVNRTERQPALKLSRTCEPFELASVAHVARLREVEAQSSNKAKIFSNGHASLSIRSGLLPLSSWVILMMTQRRVEKQIAISRRCIHDHA